MDKVKYKGHVVLIMGPTGSGKGSIVKYILGEFPELKYSVSCTTRAMRPGEIDGREYHFLSNEDFDHKIEREEFIEWAEFGGNRYGTLKSELIDRIALGEVVVTEIELQGILQLERIIPEENHTLIFIDAGGWDVLKSRALSRAPMTEAELELRYERYLHEIRSKELAKFVIDNSDGRLDVANKEISIIIKDIIGSVKIN